MSRLLLARWTEDTGEPVLDSDRIGAMGKKGTAEVMELGAHNQESARTSGGGIWRLDGILH